MPIELEKEIPKLVMPAAMMFAYPSAVADLYVPAIEQIYLPERYIQSYPIRMTVAPGQTGIGHNESFRYRLYKKVLKPFQKDSTLDYSGHFIFDARYDTDQNVAHVIDCVTAVLWIQKSLSAHLDRDVKVHVVLRERAPNLARQVFETLNIPIICTDGSVFGDIISDAKQLRCSDFRALIPEIFNVDFKGYNPTTPERVFIPRRGNRSLINNDEVAEFLEARGFKTLYFEDLTISEEWSIARNAKVAVLVHGAACAHFMLNRLGLQTPDQPGSGLKYVDLFSPSFVLTGARPLVAAINGRWAAVRGQITPQIIRELDFKKQDLNPLKSPVKDPFRIDLKTLEMALDSVDFEGE